MNNKKKLLIILLFIIVITIGCKDNSVNENNIVEEINYGDFKGYLWEVENNDAKVYLFGSVHLAESSIYPLHKDVEDAYFSSDYLVVEADITDLTEFQSLSYLMRYEGDDNIYNHLSENGINNFILQCEEIGINPKLFERLKIWAAGSNIMSMQLLNSEYTADAGIDMYFLNKAKDEKEILELESIKFQLEMFNKFSDKDQEIMFFEEIMNTEDTVDEFKILYNKFLEGDENSISEYLIDPSDEKFNDVVLYDRNKGMANKIEEYLQTDKIYFVVVGLGHYIGEKSVIEILKDQGYTVNRK